MNGGLVPAFLSLILRDAMPLSQQIEPNINKNSIEHSRIRHRKKADSRSISPTSSTKKQRNALNGVPVAFSAQG
jgi:hypothetical protein